MWTCAANGRCAARGLQPAQSFLPGALTMAVACMSVHAPHIMLHGGDSWHEVQCYKVIMT